MKDEFNKCYNDYLKKLFLIIINYIIVNIVLIIFYFSGEIKYDVFISFLFFGNIMYLIYRIPTIKSYINIKRIKKYLKKGKGKLQEVVFWNNLDTMFFLGGVICCNKKNKYYLKDKMGFNFRVVPDNIQTVTTLYNSKITSIDFSDFNLDSVRIDILDENILEINNIISTVKECSKLSGKAYTNGNLYREV